LFYQNYKNAFPTVYGMLNLEKNWIQTTLPKLAVFSSYKFD
jgi:hypothetical protein